MPYAPTDKWYNALIERESLSPVFILDARGAPVRWSTRPVRPRTLAGNADRVSFSGSGSAIEQAASVGTVASRAFVASIWLKGGSTHTTALQLVCTDGTQSGALTLTLTKEWKRYAIVKAFSASVATTVSLKIVPTGAGAYGYFWAWGAMLAETDAYATDAPTYEATVAAAGSINLLTRSEDLSHSAWTKTSSSITADNDYEPDSIFAPYVAGGMQVKGLTGNRVYPNEGRYAVGDAQLQLLNDGSAVSEWVATERSPLARALMREATLYLGDASMPENEYQPVWSGFVWSHQTEGGAEWDVQLLTRLMAFDRKIMLNCKTVEGSVVERDATLPYKAFRGNADLSAVDDYYNGWTFTATGGQNEQFTATVSDYVGATRKITLSGFASNLWVPNDKFSLRNSVTIQGNPVNIAMRILLGDFALTGDNQTDFPLTSVTGVAPTGLGLKRSDLDITQIKAQRDLWIPTHVFQISFEKEETAREFLEQQIFKLLQAYPLISKDGKIRIKMARPDPPSATLVTLGPANCAGLPKWKRMVDDIVTEVVVEGDFNPDTGNYQELARRSTSDARYDASLIQRTQTIEVRSRGLRTSLGGVAIAEAYCDRVLSRFGSGGPEEIEWKGGPKIAMLEPGERVLVSHPALPSLTEVPLGKDSQSFEVTSIQFDQGFVTKITLTGFYPTGRPAFIAAASASDTYAAATDADKLYCYSSPSSGPFADGGAPYTVV